jgi:predicted lactoylglutathione lyase
MAFPALVSLVTLGVRDVAASTAFYEALGFPLSAASVAGEVSFFRTPGCVLALWGEEALRSDAAAPPGDVGAFKAASFAINVSSREEVDQALALAVEAGATIPRGAEATDWGGYNGYFADLDGHLWEVAHNPFWPLDERGLPQLP